MEAQFVQQNISVFCATDNIAAFSTHSETNSGKLTYVTWSKDKIRFGGGKPAKCAQVSAYVQDVLLCGNVGAQVVGRAVVVS